MKQLLLFCLLLALPRIEANAQKRKAKAAEVEPVRAEYHLATTPGKAYHLLADTATASPVIPPLEYQAGNALLVTGKLGAKWLQVTTQGVKYFVASSSISPEVTDNFSAASTPLSAPNGATGQSAPSSGGSYSPSHSIQTGPRGGRYYINGNGNKTYIRRK